MKRFLLSLSILTILITFSSCVQKTYDRKVRFLLDVSQMAPIKSCGLRGSNSPLSWDQDLEMKPLIKDSLYSVDVTFNTGYLGCEVKFVVNGQFELQNKDNRRIPFDVNKDTTIYSAVFDKINP
jgi:PBP1b-binding outer membrane lipoprotein LpoB